MAKKPTYEELEQRVRELEKRVKRWEQTESEQKWSHKDLQRRIEAHTAELLETNKQLQRQISERKRAEQINRTLFQISNAINTTENLDELYASIHNALGTIIDLTNFYIAIYSKENNSVAFPYFVDEFDNDYDYIENFSESKSLTGEVILLREPIFLTHDLLKQRAAENRILGTMPVIWIGVPLKIKDEVIGVMAVQSYSNPNHFDRIDMEILNSVSDQVAIAIERKSTEQALRESEEKYSTVLEATPDPIVVCDIEGKVTYFNPAFKHVFGWALEELLGKKMDIFVPEEAWPKTKMLIEKMIEGERFSNIETLRHTKKGESVPVSVSGAIFRDRDGNPLGSVINLRDISEQKKMESQLQQAQKMESLGTLAGGIAHDFNNLLTGIQGRTSMVLMDTDLSQSHSEHLKEIENYVKSAANLTKQLLGFARGGKYEVKPTNINELIKKENQMFGRTRKEIGIRENFEKNIWTVDIDQGQIEQVLLNIFVNAGQAMSGGGNLYIQTENVLIDEDYIKPHQVEPGKYVKISITDTGTGMDEATRQRIFDPFFTTKEIGRGTGLGLASVYGIIKNHNGCINVYSEKGEGTTFNIYLPASEKEATKEAAPDEKLLWGKETLLLVDDEGMIADVACRIIEKLGYKVLTAKSGKEAIGIYEKNQGQIDMVILDMIMPEMSGGETYNKLKEISPDIKVLLSSGYSMNGQATEILERGCNGFIQKPFRITDLSQKIRQILDKD